MSSNSDLQQISHSPWWSKTTRASHLNLEMSLTHFHGCQDSSQSTWTTTTSTTSCTSTSTLRSFESQGLSLAEAKNIKENCGKCSVTLWPNTVHVSCYHCNKGHHQKCSTGPKGLPCDIDWNCNKCAKILQQSSSANIPQPPAPTNTAPSQQLPGLSKLHAWWWEFTQHAR